jgi:multiple sugar transport system substrate-binding protein
MKRRPEFCALVLALLLPATVLAGCARGGDADGTGSRGAAVRLLLFGSPDELAAYRELADAYRAAAPGASVELVEASDRSDLIAKLSTSIAGGSPPDVFLMNYRFYGQFAAKDAIEPLDDRLAKSGVIRPDAYYRGPMEAFRWRGRQLCLPQNVSSLAVYYNRDLFRRYGVPEPRAGWTWNDLVATARALTRTATGAPVRPGESEGANRAAVYGLGIEASVIRLAPFVWSHGGDIVDNPQRPTRLTFDSPAAREALRNLVDLRQAYGVVPTDDEVESEDDESRFANGRLAMLMNSRRVTTTFRSITAFEWDVAPIPTYDTPANVLHSDAYCVTRASKNKDNAWRFLQFAFGPDGQRIMAGTGRTVPSHVEVSRSSAFLGPAQPPRSARVFLEAIDHIRALPTISTWPEIEDVTGGILENALYRGDKLDDVIRQLDEQTRPMFARGQTP